LAARGRSLWRDVGPALVLHGCPDGRTARAASSRGAIGSADAAEDDGRPTLRRRAGGPKGMAVDLVREAMATQGIEVRIVAVPFSRCMFMARNGEAAGCFNATIVADNRGDYHWHATPMFHEELAIFAVATPAPANGASPISLKDLEGRRVGYTLGYTYPAEFRQNPKIRKISAKSDQVLIEMLLAGRVDHVLLNTAPAYLRLRQIGRPPQALAKVSVLSMDGFWVAFSRQRPDGEALAARFEAGLAALKSSGRLQALQQQMRQSLGIADLPR
jgi:polar amino acid transport system substrate-binding protein